MTVVSSILISEISEHIEETTKLEVSANVLCVGEVRYIIYTKKDNIQVDKVSGEERESGDLLVQILQVRLLRSLDWAIQEVLDLIAPLDLVRRLVPWWNKSLVLLRNNVHNILRCVRSTKGGHASALLYRRKQGSTNLFKKSKCLSWCEYGSRYDSINDVSREFDRPEKTIKNILARHFPSSELYPYPDLLWEAVSVSLLEKSHNLDSVNTLEKLVTSMLSFHRFKVAGPDGISPCVLKHLQIKMLVYLRLLFACCL
ncbi:unnamed protein product [Lepeophtheirus salmonis]|uniref:(salmon louse) hypothetical protein n=1 Tax=Lepeophtheirus salmonis TaxID=72036 RepID=A0A7R8CB05_LEPSM|nr:unnamed protein product [Lepeophtheirus salmonis]CAF2753803.1 unnamed protein product [Lepeophtheirus salmonis]